MIRIVRYWCIQLMIGTMLGLRLGKYLPRLLPGKNAIAVRARYGIHAFVGENGSGKTMTMVRQALRAMDRGQLCYSTVELYAVIDGVRQLHPNYRPFTGWDLIKGMHDCVVLLDEAHALANARESQGMPFEVQTFINQLRKRRIKLLWSAPDWSRCDKVVRDVTKAVTWCVGSWSDNAAFRAAVAADSDEIDEGWIPNRVFRCRTYKMQNFAEFTATAKKVDPVADEWFYGPGSRAFLSYDTNAEVLRLGTASDSGVCTTCGGSRRRPECSCHDYQQRKADRKAEVASSRRAADAPHFHPATV